MRVPTHQRQIGEETPQIREPRVPAPIEPAFGADVAKAITNLGETGVERGLELQEHIERERYYRAKEQGTAFGAKFLTNLQNKVFSTEPKTIRGSDGKDYDIPDGFLNRQLSQADGVTVDYDEYIRNQVIQTIKQMPNPTARIAFIESVDTQVRAYRERILNHEVKQKNEMSKDVLNNEIKAQFDAYPLLNEEERGKVISYLDKQIDAVHQRGVYTLEEAEKQKGDIRDKAFTFDLMNNLVLTEKKLDSNAYGFDIERLKWAKELYDKRINKTQNENEEVVIDEHIKGELTAEKVIVLRNAKQISAKFALNMIEALNKEPAIRTDWPTYDNIMLHIISGDMSGTDIRTMILTSRDKLSNTDFNHLLYVEKIGGLDTPAESYVREQKELTYRANRPKSTFWKTVWQNTKTAFPYAANFVMANIVTRIQKEGTKDEQIVNIAKDEIRKQQVKDNGWISNLPKGGKLCRDKYGNKAIIYPDGTYEEVMAGTGEFIHKEQRTKKKQEGEK